MAFSEVQAVFPAVMLVGGLDFLSHGFCGVANHDRQVSGCECREIISAVTGKDNLLLLPLFVLSPPLQRKGFGDITRQEVDEAVIGEGIDTADNRPRCIVSVEPMD